MPIPEAPFDGGRTWLDVRDAVANQLRRKFRSLNIEDVLDDALSEVMCDLMGYWSQLPSSTRDGAFTYAFAIRRGTWMGVKKVTDIFEHNTRILPFDPTSPHWLTEEKKLTAFDDAQGTDEARYEQPKTNGYFDFVDPSIGPEEVVCEDDELSRARKMLAAFSNEELQEFFAELTGESVREEAARTGVTKDMAFRRRKERATRLRVLAAPYGLSA